MDTFSYDLVVIGAGSGGYAAARTARELGASVAFVDRGPLGGLCILRGCMPSKTLLASSDLAYDVAEGGELGIHADAPSIDLAHIFSRKRRIIAGFADYRIEAIKSFPLYEGAASFEGPHRLRVGEDVVLEAKNFVVATGSVVSPPALPGLAEAGFIDSDAVLERDRLPASVAVLGGGYVGSELGQFMARMGVKTTFLIRSPRLLSPEDADVGDALTGYFRADGIDVLSGVQLTSVEVSDGRKVVHYHKDGERRSLAVDEIFYALGRVPNLAGLELDRVGVTCHPISGIEVGPDMRTVAPHIFAVGDVTGPYQLVHVAIYQGELAARNAVNATAEPADYSLQKTHTIFTDPQVAVVGETEKSLQASGTPYVVGSYPFGEHGKAVSINKTKGFVKMMASPIDGKIVGAAVVGPEASDLIHEVIVAMYYRGTVHDFVKIPHLHPTLAEIWTYPAEEIVARLTTAMESAVA
ncbi:MAG: FAD-dependent oxidoreductase [Candidatus Eremiobacteraeota bacterium]|nr:FAD-dependent oxidoreductase [Candidatus Eremiobacteraeota bacterium]